MSTGSWHQLGSGLLDRDSASETMLRGIGIATDRNVAVVASIDRYVSDDCKMGQARSAPCYFLATVSSRFRRKAFPASRYKRPRAPG